MLPAEKSGHESPIELKDLSIEAQAERRRKGKGKVALDE